MKAQVEGDRHEGMEGRGNSASGRGRIAFYIHSSSKTKVNTSPIVDVLRNCHILSYLILSYLILSYLVYDKI